MAWNNVKCIECGEEYRVQLYGKISSRNWKVENWSGSCDDCKKKRRDAMLAQNEKSDLPKLTGSEKQIAWAMSIRKNALDTPDFTALSQDETSASAWIDARFDIS